MTLSDLYQQYVVDLDPILWEMGRVNGIYVDNDKRLALLDEMNGKVGGFVKEAQQYVPAELFPTKRYKNEPDNETLSRVGSLGVEPIRVDNPQVKTCSRCGLQHVTKSDHTSRKGGRNGVPENPCYKAEIVLLPGTDIEYSVRLPFNPGSDDQLRDYAGRFHHKLGRNWKTGESTLDVKQLDKIIAKHGDQHPIYRLAKSVREVRKARGYAKAWVPNHEGKIFGHFKNVPETLRLSQAEHNFMNVSHRGEAPYAEELRQCLIAPPGYSIVEGDSSSVEAVFTGQIMGSKSYMEMAARGIHSIWAAQKLGLEPTKENIKKIKNPGDYVDLWPTLSDPWNVLKVTVLYETKKRTVHGVSYGMEAKLLHETYPQFFPSVWLEADGEVWCRWCHRKKSPQLGHRCELYTAQQEIDAFYEFVPDLKSWHDSIRKFAYQHGYLQSAWGFRNYYYSVLQFDWKTQKWKLGTDAKAVIAFLPQHSNGMFQRENLIRIHKGIGKMGKRGKWFMPAIGHVHDSNGILVPDDDIDKAKELLFDSMYRPIPQLGNILVGVQVKAGKNWAEMKAIGSV